MISYSNEHRDKCWLRKSFLGSKFKSSPYFTEVSPFSSLHVSIWNLLCVLVKQSGHVPVKSSVVVGMPPPSHPMETSCVEGGATTCYVPVS